LGVQGQDASGSNMEAHISTERRKEFITISAMGKGMARTVHASLTGGTNFRKGLRQEGYMKKLRMRTALAVVALCGIAVNAQDKSSSSVTASGTADYIALWTTNTNVGDSVLFQKSGNVGIGTTTPKATLDVNGAVNAATSFNLNGLTFAWAPAYASIGVGPYTLQDNTTGYDNTAFGFEALQHNSTGLTNTAIGTGAATWNTGSGNTAVGNGALYGVPSGTVDGGQNTAVGVGALAGDTTGGDNAAAGWQALVKNTTGDYNTGDGYGALAENTTGSGNDAHGFLALYLSTTGNDNVGIGSLALYNNVTGSSNTAIGALAGPDPSSTNLTNATAIGFDAVVSESNALVLGGTGTNAVKVGIGTATPANVFTIAQGAGPAVADGWSVYSSRRFKTNIRTIEGALRTVEQLRGVSYDQKSDGKRQIGVIAEEVGTVIPEVVTWENNGTDAQSVDYSRLTALLIEATKEQQTVIQEQQTQLKTQQAQIDELTSQVKTIRTSLASFANDPLGSTETVGLHQ
jgi:Chaperone of endosialidase